MTKVSLLEFQRLAGISDSSLVWLLAHNQVKCEVTAERGIEIDIESADIKNLVQAIAARKQSSLESQEKLLTQKFTRIIAMRLNEMIDEATSRLNARNGKN